MLSSEFKGSLDSFTFFSFEVVLLRVELLVVEDPSKLDTEESVVSPDTRI